MLSDEDKKEALARKVMDSVDPELVEQFVTVVRFLHENPDSGFKASAAEAGKSPEQLMLKLAMKFCHSRQPSAPTKPTTVPDRLVSLILHRHFKVAEESLDRAQHEHLLSMGAENMVGNLLERFIASKLEPHGWVWCSGSIVKSADFIKPPAPPSKDWTILQVKNRDNSENSSSSAIRKGTKIEKWFRTFSRRDATNWQQFPETEFRSELTEAEFHKFVKGYLNQFK
jgi:hypothetical protein